MESSLELSNSLGSVSSLLSGCRTFKVLVIGDSAVGKTCLTHRLSAGHFPSAAEATIGVDFRERVLDVDGEMIKLQLWDTAGQERFRKSMVQHFYRNVHAVLFVYDVTCRASFDSLSGWVEECRRNSLGQQVLSFLVGNKSDLRDVVRADVLVSQELAIRFAKAHNMTFFETSAKSTSGRQRDAVEDVVNAVGARLRRHKGPGAAYNPSYSGSFKVFNKKKQEKEMWSCC
ncbi:ras-related protein Rab-33B-like [Syngnathoides biaculeatus]|uniref:ras-related protein Rab-33B-like n=1 Tax=Syngnathoides biaculeatus TaxID=300417 RepID=UPI002ADE94EA|nr:ras-related protein Rab-33B-like [Syngnathoides biaculeatus]